MHPILEGKQLGQERQQPEQGKQPNLEERQPGRSTEQKPNPKDNKGAAGGKKQGTDQDPDTVQPKPPIKDAVDGKGRGPAVDKDKGPGPVKEPKPIQETTDGKVQGTVDSKEQGIDQDPDTTRPKPKQPDQRQEPEEVSDEVPTKDLAQSIANDPPVAANDFFEIEEDTRLELSPAMLTSNDKDLDSTRDLKIRSISSKSAIGAKIAKTREGLYIYRPKPDYFGLDSFTYIVSDEFGATSGAKVEITVVPVNDPPTVRNDFARVPEGSQGFAIEVLMNDFDKDKDELKLISVTQAQNGAVEIDIASGLPVYTPKKNYLSQPNAPDSFSYTVSDGKGESSEGIVKVLVTSVNDRPIVKIQKVSTDEDTPVEITLTAEDPDEDDLSYRIVKRPRKGKLSGQAPKLAYTPEKNYFGPDSFTYVVNDGKGGISEGVVKIKVNPVFDPAMFLTKPSELSGRYGIGEEIQFNVRVENPERSRLEYQLAGLPEASSANLRPVLTGVNFAWLPKSNSVGKHDITISAISGDHPPVDLRFTLEIFQVNRNPILSEIKSILIDPEKEATATIRIEATDPDQGEMLTFKAVRIGGSGSKPRIGEVKLAPLEGGGTSASVDFTWISDPEKDLGRLVTFKVFVSDDEDGRAQAKFSVGVGSVNTPPTLTVKQKAYNIREMTPINLTGTANRFQDENSEGLDIQFSARDAEGDLLKLSVEGLPPGADFQQSHGPDGEFVGTLTWLPDLEAGDGPKGFKIYTLQLKVVEKRTDDKAPLEVIKPVRIRVEDRNILPQMKEISDQQVREGETLLVNFKAFDIDEDEIKFQVTGLPLGAELNDVGPGVAQLEWTPSFTAATGQTLEVTVSALDSKSAAIREGVNNRAFNIMVINANRAPKLAGKLKTLSVKEGEVAQFTVEFVDPDLLENPDEKIELKLDSPVEGAELISSGPGKGTFRWQTDFDSGTLEAYHFKVLAVDSAGEEAEAPFRILVDNVNRNPEFSSIEMPAQVVEKENIAVDLLAVDPDNAEEALTYKVRGKYPKGLVTVAGSSLLIEPKLGDAGTYTLKLVVIDGEGAKAKTEVELNVVALNLRPVAEPITPIYNAVEGDKISFVLAFTDPNEDKLAISVSDQPDGVIFDAESGAFSWTPRPGQAGQYNLIFSGQELETQEQYKVNVPTQLVVIKREGPMLRNLSVEGSRGSVVISVNLEVPNQGVAEVTFVVDGTVLDKQADQQTGEVSFTWNTSGYGAEAKTEYEVSAVATDGVIENSVTIGPLVIDNLPPSIEAPSSVVEAGTGDSLEFNASVRDNGAVKTVTFVFVDQEQQASGTGTGNSYRTRFVVPKNPKAVLRSAGINISDSGGVIEFPYYIRAEDSAGNQARYPQEGSLLIHLLDRTPPQARIDKTRVMVNQGESVTLDGGRSIDNSGKVDEYAWDIDNSDGVNFTASTNKNKKLVFKAEKSTVVSLRVRDGSSNEAIATVQVEVIDKTPPSPPELTGIEVKGANVVITGIAEPKSEVDIRLVGAVKFSAQIPLEMTGTFETTISDIADGKYQLTATATDVAGNPSRLSEAVELVVDTRSPEISISLGEVADGNQTGNVRPPVPVQVFDANGLALIDLVL